MFGRCSEGVYRIKIRVFFSKLSPQTVVTAKNLTPFVFTGIKNVVWGAKSSQLGYSEMRKQLVNLED